MARTARRQLEGRHLLFEEYLRSRTTLNKVSQRRQRSKRRFLIKSPLVFFQSFSQLLQVAYFGKCK